MADGQAIDRQQQDRPDDGCDQTGSGVVGTVEAERAAQQVRHERTADAEKDGHDDAARILAGHDRLRERADDEADDESPEQMLGIPFFCGAAKSSHSDRSDIHAKPAHGEAPESARAAAG